MKNKLRLMLWSLAPAVLLAPLTAMQFTNDVQWTAFDFAFASGLMIAAGLAFEAVAALTRNRTYRIIAGAVLAVVFALIWIDGAVGLF